MAPPLAELTAKAQTLTSAGDLVGARAVLAHALDPADAANPQRATADLAVAAALHARILIALGDPHTARVWAAFAHAAEARLHGPHDGRTLAAATIHAAVLQRVGNHGRAAQLYHDLVLELINLDGPDSQRVLAAQADLATAEHSAGNCTAARARLAEAWAHYRRVYGDGAPAGIKMLARLGALERECGRVSDSMHHLSLAAELCARHLPEDNPLGQQVAALAQAPATGRHHCGRVAQSTGPDGPVPGVTPIYPTAVPVESGRPVPGDLTGRHARTEAPAPLPGPDDRPTQEFPVRSPDRQRPSGEPGIQRTADHKPGYAATAEMPARGGEEADLSPARRPHTADRFDAARPSHAGSEASAFASTELRRPPTAPSDFGQPKPTVADAKPPAPPAEIHPARPSTVKPPPADPPVFVPLPPDPLPSPAPPADPMAALAPPPRAAETPPPAGLSRPRPPQAESPRPAETATDQTRTIPPQPDPARPKPPPIDLLRSDRQATGIPRAEPPHRETMPVEAPRGAAGRANPTRADLPRVTPAQAGTASVDPKHAEPSHPTGPQAPPRAARPTHAEPPAHSVPPAQSTPLTHVPPPPPPSVSSRPVSPSPSSPPLPGSAAAGPWRVGAGQAGDEPTQPISPSPTGGAMRPTESDRPRTAPRQSRAGQGYPAGAAHPSRSGDASGAGRASYGTGAQPDNITRAHYPTGTTPGQPENTTGVYHPTGATPGQPENTTGVYRPTTAPPGRADDATRADYARRTRPGQAAGDAPGVQSGPADGVEWPSHADGVYQSGRGGPPDNGGTRTGRAGPLGWRPPANLPPAETALRSVPHPEVVLQRPVQSADHLLPVPVERPQQRNSWQPIGLIAALVAGILVAAGIVAVTMRRGADDAATPTAVSASAAPLPSASATPSPVGGAPGNIKLRDNRDSVSLTWSYPKGSEGPVLISGGRSGQEQRAFQQLPAGTTDYVVYGLNSSQDYCFTVAVVYTVDRVAASKPVCTNRK